MQTFTLTLPAPPAPGFTFTLCPPMPAQGLTEAPATLPAPPPEWLAPGHYWHPPVFCGGVASMVATRRAMLAPGEYGDD